MPRVTLYARAGCPLCDEARQQLLELRAQGAAFDLRELDIEADPRLHSVFLERIPVVEVDGEIVSELFMDMQALRTRLDMLAA